MYRTDTKQEKEKWFFLVIFWEGGLVWDRVSLYSSDWPGTHCIDRAYLKVPVIHLLCLPSAGIKSMLPTGAKCFLKPSYTFFPFSLFLSLPSFYFSSFSPPFSFLLCWRVTSRPAHAREVFMHWAPSLPFRETLGKTIYNLAVFVTMCCLGCMYILHGNKASNYDRNLLKTVYINVNLRALLLAS